MRQFAGGRRFELVSRLGSGGRGLVYRARDRGSGREVALKTLRALGPDEILRLKREFRELRSIRHDNVVRLYELAEEDGHWYYTMELLRGLPLMPHVRPYGELDIDLLRPALRQLAIGLVVLHQHGVVHCDVKPSNIMVEHNGRAVLLDPGVSLRGRGSSSGDAFGTPEYMAPEQGEGLAVGGSADWYALGCVLYEALEGTPPYTGTRLQVLSRKAEGDVEVPDGEHPELRELAAQLLRVDPKRRPKRGDILVALGADAVVDDAVHEPLVGRDQELRELHQAWQRARGGVPTTIFVHGEAGIGKSALLDAFAGSIQPARRLFRARCDPRETVSFRAVDSLVDSVAEYLADLDIDHAIELLPPRTDLLSRAFPVMRRVDAVLRHAPRGPADEPVERALLAEALSQLLAAIARNEGGIAVILEDLDLSDEDSVPILTRLAAQLPSTPWLLIGSFRLTTTAVAWVDEVHDAARDVNGYVDHLMLEALPEAAARKLSQAVAARDKRTSRRSASMRAVTAEPVPGDPLASAEPDARALAELIAIAGEPPLSAAILCRALAWDLGRFDAALHDLEDLSLVRRSSTQQSSVVEIDDAAVGKRIAGGLHGEDKRSRHRQLAIAVAAEPGNDERAGFHFDLAGDDRRAARSYARAAEAATARLAFATGNRLFGYVLDRLPADDPRRGETLTLRADCLQATGDLAGAADAYLEAASTAPPAGALELKRCAADCLIRNGQPGRGMAVQREVLTALGVSLPKTPAGALRSLLLRRLRVRTRGLGFTPRKPGDVPVELALRTDTLLGAGLELTVVDFVRGGDLQTRGLLSALETGDPNRIARALIAEAAYAGGQGDHKRCDALLQRASDMIGHEQDPYLAAYWRIIRGATLVVRGQWDRGLEACEAGIAGLRDSVAGVDWEVNVTEHFARWAMFYGGNLSELTRRVLKQLHAADTRGDRFTSSSLRTGFGSLAWLARDEPELALDHCDRAAQNWPTSPFMNQHWYELLARANALLYQQRGSTAASLLESRWPLVKRSLILRVECVRIEALFVRARAELSMAGNSAALQRAEVWRRKLEREKLPWAHALASLVGAAIARRKDSETSARELAVRAESQFREQGAELFARVAALGRAEIDGDYQTRSATRDWARAAGISRMDRLSQAFAPGLVSSRSQSPEPTSETLPVKTLRLPHHMTRSWAGDAVRSLDRTLAEDGPIGLVIDASELERFDADARSRFTNWAKANRRSLVRIGAVTDRLNGRLIIRATGQILRVPTRAFTRADECHAWVQSGDE